MEQRSSIGNEHGDDGRNPYTPPAARAQQALPEHDEDTRSRWPTKAYRVINWLYIGLVALGTLAVVTRGPPELDVVAVIVAACFYAPIACFCVVRWTGGRHLRKVVAGYGLFLLPFLGFVVWDLVSTGSAPLPIMTIAAINSAALLSGVWQMRRTQS